MAAVIESYLLMSNSSLTMQPLPTWSPGSRFRTTLMTLRSISRVVAMNNESNVVHLHLSERGSFFREGAFAIICAFRKIPVVATLHGADFTSFARNHPTLVRTILTKLSRVITLGPEHLELVSELAPDVPASIVLNPVDIPTQVVPAEERIQNIVFAGEVGMRKGFDRIIAAWETSAEAGWSLIACGPEGDMSPISVASNEYKYLGALSRANARELVASARAMCLPSRAEVLPMSILEAVAAGTHVVATRVGEYRSLLGCPNITWISADDASCLDELRAALTRLFTGSHDDTQSHAGRSWISENASIPVVRQQLEAVYLDVIA